MDTDYNKIDWDTIGAYNREYHPETTLERAQLHIENNNFHQAILDLNSYTKSTPSTSIGYLLLGRCFYLSNNLVNAIEAFKKGLAQAANEVDYEFLYEYARALLHTGKNIEALNVTDKMLNQESDNIRGFLIKSQGLYALQEYEKAFYYSTKVTELNADIWQGWLIRFNVSYSLKDYARAISDFKKVLSLNKNLRPHEHTIYASALLNSGFKVEAIKEFEFAMLAGDTEAKEFFIALTKS
ncbi:MAG: hypothetical protein JWR38_5925 [Mucilaginibacter sp.]|nr:hypothetical protein [Mucilaginibacter sp.]